MSKTFFWGQFVWNAINGAFWLWQKDCHNCRRKQTKLMKRNASILFPFEWNNNFSFWYKESYTFVDTHQREYLYCSETYLRLVVHPYLLLLLFYKSCSSSHFRNLQIVAPPFLLGQASSNSNYISGKVYIKTPFFIPWQWTWRF